IRALLNYHPQPFAGTVHLFRSPIHQLLCSFDSDYGWEDFAAGGVHITVIPGAHEKILEEPSAGVLAAALTKCLAESPETTPQKSINTGAGEANAAIESAAPEHGSIPRRAAAQQQLSFAQQRTWFLSQ